MGVESVTQQALASRVQVVKIIKTHMLNMHRYFSRRTQMTSHGMIRPFKRSQGFIKALQNFDP